MKRIWNFLQRWFGYYRGPEPLAYARTKNEADNKILDQWFKEYEGRIDTEALEEYQRRVLQSFLGSSRKARETSSRAS